jgi:hypothetical protein
LRDLLNLRQSSLAGRQVDTTLPVRIEAEQMAIARNIPQQPSSIGGEEGEETVEPVVNPTFKPLANFYSFATKK